MKEERIPHILEILKLLSNSNSQYSDIFLKSFLFIKARIKYLSEKSGSCLSIKRKICDFWLKDTIMYVLGQFLEKIVNVKNVCQTANLLILEPYCI